jgi:DNA polymerase-3 subunit delta'
VFILVSSMPDALLPTVLSRCPRLRFSELPAGDVAAVLIRDHGYEASAAHAAAVESDGSIGLALASQSVDVADARAAAQQLLEQVAQMSDPIRRLEAAKDLTGKKTTPAGERDQLGAMLRALGSLLRDLGILATRSDQRTLANADLADDLGRLTSTFDGERVIRAFAAVDHALGALERNASPKVVADWLVLQL